MSKVELKYILEQLLILKTELKKLSEIVTPTWQKDLQALTPLIAAVIAGGLTFFITWLAFKWNKEKDANIRKEQDVKELQQKKNKIYGEAFGLVDEIVNNILLYNRYRIETSKYGAVISEGYELDASHTKNITDLCFTSREHSEKMLKEVRIARTKFVTLIGDMYALNSNTSCLALYGEYSIMMEGYEYDSANEFGGIETLEGINEKNDELIASATEFIKSTIGDKLSQLLRELRSEI